jgi:RNA polymerase sigma-70 factor (ECF subfamily)
MDADLLLLERWRAGDTPAGEELFHRHFAGVHRFFESKVWNAAEDLTQQTFLECVKARDRFRAESTFRTYLFAIAWNQLRHHLRSAANDAHVDFDTTSIGDLVAGSTSPSGQVDRARERQLIHRALARLPASQQTLLEYHYWHDLDAAALAEIFGVPPGTIRVRLLRARNALRAQLESLQAPVGEPVADSLMASLASLEIEDRSLEEGGT